MQLCIHVDYIIYMQISTYIKEFEGDIMKMNNYTSIFYIKFVIYD